MNKVTINTAKKAVVTLASTRNKVKVTARSHKVIFSRAGVQGPPGEQGANMRSDADIITLIKQTVHADALHEGISVDTAGNLQLTFGTLPPLP